MRLLADVPVKSDTWLRFAATVTTSTASPTYWTKPRLIS